MLPRLTVPLSILVVLSSATVALSQNNKMADEAYNEGVKLLSARELEKARAPLEKALALAPDKAYATKVYLALLRVYRTLPETDKMSEAGEHILRHSESLTDRSTTASSLASFYLQRGKVEEQMKRYREMYEKNKDDYAAIALMAELARSAKVTPETEQTYKEQYKKALQKVAGEFAVNKEKEAEAATMQKTWLWKEAAVLWSKAGDNAKAVSVATKAEESGPETRKLLDHFWHANLGDVYLTAGKYPEAVKHFEKAIATTEIKGYKDTCKLKMDEAKKKIDEKK